MPGSITADGVATSTVTVTVRDANDNVRTVGGDAVVLNTTLGTLGAVTDNVDGTYTATLTAGTVAGTATVTGTVNTLAIADDATVSFTPGAADAASTTASVPNGTVNNPTTITITVRDANGNVRTAGGDAGLLAVSVSGANTANPTPTDNLDGTYTVTYTPTNQGTDTIAITLDGTPIGGSPYTSTVSP